MTAEDDRARDLLREQTKRCRIMETDFEMCKKENKKLINALKFYANTEWADLSLIDRGNMAKKTLKECGE